MGSSRGGAFLAGGVAEVGSISAAFRFLEIVSLPAAVAAAALCCGAGEILIFGRLDGGDAFRSVSVLGLGVPVVSSFGEPVDADPDADAGDGLGPPSLASLRCRICCIVS